MRIVPAVIIAFAAIVVLGMALSMLGTDPGVCATYQEMRQIYEETQGEYGWPEGAVRGCDYE